MTYIIIFPRLESFIAENEIVKLPTELAKNINEHCKQILKNTFLKIKRLEV